MAASFVFPRYLKTLITLLLLVASTEAQSSVLVIKQTFKNNDPSQESVQYRELQEGFKAGLKRHNLNTQIQVVDIDDEEELARVKANPDKYKLVVGLGTIPALYAKEHFDNAQILYSMVLNPNRHQMEMGPRMKDNIVGGIRARLRPMDYIKSIKAIHPDVKTVGLVYQSDFFKEYVEEIMKSGNSQGIKFVFAKINNKREFAANFKRVLQEGIDLFLMLPDTNLFERTYQQIYLKTVKQGIPCVGPSYEYVKAGALWGVVISPYDIGERTAEMLKEVLQGSQITVEYPRTSTLVLNEKIAKKLNFTFPEQPFLDAKTQGNVVD